VGSVPDPGTNAAQIAERHDPRRLTRDRLTSIDSGSYHSMSMEPLGRQLYLTYRAMRDRLDEDLRALGGSVPQWIVLKSVGDEPDLSQRELADRVLVTGSTLTHHLDRMEGDGFITRNRDTTDRRIVRISLTASGKHRRTELENVVAAADRRLRGLLADDDAEVLQRILAGLRHGLERDDDEGGPR
jgi:DNA-binding MarR family transcriptional regulator